MIYYECDEWEAVHLDFDDGKKPEEVQREEWT